MEAHGRKKERGGLMENDVTVEILKNRIPTATCKSLRKRTLRLCSFSTSPAAIHHCFKRKGKSNNADQKLVLI
jgi:hypothetical protein